MVEYLQIQGFAEIRYHDHPLFYPQTLNLYKRYAPFFKGLYLLNEVYLDRLLKETFLNCRKCSVLVHPNDKPNVKKLRATIQVQRIISL